MRILASEAIRKAQAELDYYIKEQGWDEAYARRHVEVVFEEKTGGPGGSYEIGSGGEVPRDPYLQTR